MNQQSAKPSQETDPLDIERALASYGDSLLRLCYLYLKDLSLAEDALQETFLNAYKSYGRFQRQCSEKTWITRIAINVCKSTLRKAWFKRVDPSADLPEIAIYDHFEKNCDHETIVAQIKKLPPKFREVILLYYYQELKVGEIADILHIPVGTVSTRLSRARERLKTLLKGWYYDETNEG